MRQCLVLRVRKKHVHRLKKHEKGKELQSERKKNVRLHKGLLKRR